MKVNKKLFKILFVFALFFLFHIDVKAKTFTYTSKETGYKAIIEDEANLLTQEQISTLGNQMIELTKYGNVAFNSTINNIHISTSSYARSYYHKKFSTQSGTLFLVDMYHREIYIFSDGENYNTITSSKAYSITDNVYRYASNGDYYKCASVAFSQVKSLLNGKMILEPMKIASNILILRQKFHDEKFKNHYNKCVLG